MNEDTDFPKQNAGWLALRPALWRSDLLRIVLRVTAVLGFLVYLPSAYFSMQTRMYGLFILDTLAIIALVTLERFARIPSSIRAIGASLVFYAVGLGLMITVGSVSQIYLYAFSLLSTLLVGMRWGIGTVVLNGLSMWLVGYVGYSLPEMGVAHWPMNTAAWSVVTANFVFINASLVLALGAVINALESALRHAVATGDALRESRNLLAIAGRTARLGGWSSKPDATELVWSEEVKALHELGDSARTPTVSEALEYYTPEVRGLLTQALRNCCEKGEPFDTEGEVITARGNRRWFRVIGTASRDAQGAITLVSGSVQDVTAQKLAEAKHHQLEGQLLQAQKMEAIGSLAGGVAHDFNNLLTVILSYTSLLLSGRAPQDPERVDLEEIKRAGLRASALTRQLLAFSRKQLLQPVVLDLNDVVLGVEKMLGRLLREDIRLSILPSIEASKVHADQGQLEQVIINLAINAGDAMPSGGKLTIEVGHAMLDESYAAMHTGVTPGHYVLLAVTDTGIGMNRATQDRIFEPFFTTKDKSKGTGLGLSMVYGIVSQSGGHIWVYSELGVGTTFKIYLPHTDRTQAPPAPAATSTVSLTGNETILLVEDEPQVREVVRTILRKQGYTVLEAQNGGEAFLVCEEFHSTIHLLITDVVMPLMSGRQVAERLTAMRPSLKVLFISGYTEDTIVHHGVLEGNLEFLPKPIMPEALLRKVRQLLGAVHSSP